LSTVKQNLSLSDKFHKADTMNKIKWTGTSNIQLNCLPLNISVVYTTLLTELKA